MPLFEYECNEHGVFSELVAVGENHNVMNCPICGISSERKISEIYLRAISNAEYKAHEINEKNAHEPSFVSKIEKKRMVRLVSVHLREIL